MRKIQDGQNTLKKSGLPWWSPGWESACWFGEHESDPWSRRIPRVERWLSSCTTTKSTCHDYWSVHTTTPVLHNEEPPQWEAHTTTRKWPPLTTARESPPPAMRTQCSQINKYIFQVRRVNKYINKHLKHKVKLWSDLYKNTKRKLHRDP